MLFLLLVLFGPLGLLCWILNACSRNRHQQTINEMNRLERQRMRLEAPDAYAQLQAEEKEAERRWRLPGVICLAVIGGLGFIGVIVNGCHGTYATSPVSYVAAVSTPTPTYTGPTEAEKAANWQRILDMEHATPTATPFDFAAKFHENMREHATPTPSATRKPSPTPKSTPKPTPTSATVNYDVLSDRMPNRPPGFRRWAILIAKSDATESRLQVLAQQLYAVTSDDKFSVINIFTDQWAAKNDCIDLDSVTKQQRARFNKAWVGQFIKRDGLLELDYTPGGMFMQEGREIKAMDMPSGNVRWISHSFGS